ncbi:MAG: hypothetical protein IJC25_05815 [Clostridia bacterium]|nr:hypothetical protein [Clostridia bacterium]
MENWVLTRKKAARVLASMIVFAFSVSIYVSLAEAGEGMIACGEMMTFLRSVSGTSVAEQYYQLQGGVYECFGGVIKHSGAFVLFVGFFFALWLIFPVILDYFTITRERKIEKMQASSIESAKSE